MTSHFSSFKLYNWGHTTVRAVRSWVGANSGMLTQKDIKFYEQKEDQTTVFRVHSIPGGMLYTNFDVSFGN